MYNSPFLTCSQPLSCFSSMRYLHHFGISLRKTTKSFMNSWEILLQLLLQGGPIFEIYMWYVVFLLELPIKYRASCLLGKLSTTKLTFQSLKYVTKLHELIYLRKCSKCDRYIFKFKKMEAI